jgi:hypothetical protein
VALLGEVLQASGGLELWRQIRRFTVHVSIGGMLCTRKCRTALLKDLVVEGSTQAQSLEINGFTAANRRASYRPERVALEDSDGQLLTERHASPMVFRGQMKSATWDELELAHYCGYLMWNYFTVPFVLAEADFLTEEFELTDGHGETFRCLKVRFPLRLVTHSAEQTFYFDQGGFLRRLDYPAEYDDQAQIAQMFSGHQRFSGILVPTLCRLLKIGTDGVVIPKPPLVDIEIFDAVFE